MFRGFLLMLLTFSVVQAEDWPRWRGATGDNKSTETGLLKEWPAGGPPKAWQINGLGRGYASVSVADGRVFTMGRQSNVEYLIALNEKDGSQLWKTPVGPGSKENGPNCTPTVDGDRVYGISFEGDLICCNVEAGDEIWKTSFQRDFGGKMMSMWGYSESPLIDGDRLICTPGSQNAMMAALDKKSGRVIWRAKIPTGSQRGQEGAGYSSIVISNAAGTKQYVQLIGRGVVGINASDGRFLWGYDKIANTTANCPTPLVSGDYIFASTGYNDGGSALLEIKGSRGRVNPREVYYQDSKTLQNHHGGMVLLDGNVYMGHGHNNGLPTCVEMRSGKRLWPQQRGPGRESAAITYADGHLYFRYQNGTVALIEANPQRLNVVSTFEEDFGDGPKWPHPVIANGKLYLRANDTLACFKIK